MEVKRKAWAAAVRPVWSSVGEKLVGKDEPNFFQRLFSGDKENRPVRYRVQVKSAGNASTVTVLNTAVNDRVEIRVSDTGPGLPEGQQERIFEEFYQVEGGLARSSGGTGLGLAIAREIVTRLGGTLEERGASWLFVRWLAAQKGEDVLGRLSRSPRTGRRFTTRSPPILLR